MAFPLPSTTGILTTFLSGLSAPKNLLGPPPQKSDHGQLIFNVANHSIGQAPMTTIFLDIVLGLDYSRLCVWGGGFTKAFL